LLLVVERRRNALWEQESDEEFAENAKLVGEEVRESGSDPLVQSQDLPPHSLGRMGYDIPDVQVIVLFPRGIATMQISFLRSGCMHETTDVRLLYLVRGPLYAGDHTCDGGLTQLMVQ